MIQLLVLNVKEVCGKAEKTSLFNFFPALQVPFIAHKQLGDSYKWLLYGDDDTVWFMDGVLKFLEDLDPDMPYFISGQLLSAAKTHLQPT